MYELVYFFPLVYTCQGKKLLCDIRKGKIMVPISRKKYGFEYFCPVHLYLFTFPTGRNFNLSRGKMRVAKARVFPRWAIFFTYYQ